MGIEFRIRDFFAPVSILRLRRAFERTQYLPLAELRSWQEGLLGRMVRHAAENVPYYRDLFRALGLAPGDIRTVDDLEKLPPLTREAVKREGRRLWWGGGRRRFRTVTTGGTSGRPITVAVDRRANAQEFVYYWRYWGWAGYRLGDRFAMLDVEAFLRRRGGVERAWAWQPAVGRLLLNPLALREDRFEEVLAGLRRHRPRFLKGHASDIYLMALLARRRGVSDLRFQALFPTAETLLPRCREVMETTFGCPAFDSYGHMERVVAVCQCERGRYHVNADYGVLRLEEVRARGAGERPLGRVVGASLHNRAMPLLRYEVGDLIEPAPPGETCPCGRFLPLVRRIAGRQEDVVVTPDGRVVTALYNVWRHVPAAEFGQVERDGPDHLTAYVVPGPGYRPADDRLLGKVLGDLLGPSIRFEIRHIRRDQVRRTPAGKVRLVIGGTPIGEVLE